MDLLAVPVRETARFEGPLHWTRVLAFARTVDQATVADMATGRPLLLAIRDREPKEDGTWDVADVCTVHAGTVDAARFDAALRTDDDVARTLFDYHKRLATTAFERLGYLPAWAVLAARTMAHVYTTKEGMPPARNNTWWDGLVEPIVKALVYEESRVPTDPVESKESVTIRARCVGSLRRVSRGLDKATQAILPQSPPTNPCLVCGSSVEYREHRDTFCLDPGKNEWRLFPSLLCRHDEHVDFERRVMTQ